MILNPPPPPQPYHYHHCANLSEDIELIKCLSDKFCRECQIKHILLFIHYTIYGVVCFQFTHFPCDDWESITLSYHHHQIRSMNYYPLFRVRSWNNGICCMSLYCYGLNRSQRNFAHIMTVTLSWRAKFCCDRLNILWTKASQNFIEFRIRSKYR